MTYLLYTFPHLTYGNVINILKTFETLIRRNMRDVQNQAIDIKKEIWPPVPLSCASIVATASRAKAFLTLM